MPPKDQSNSPTLSPQLRQEIAELLNEKGLITVEELDERKRFA